MSRQQELSGSHYISVSDFNWAIRLRRGEIPFIHWTTIGEKDEYDENCGVEGGEDKEKQRAKRDGKGRSRLQNTWRAYAETVGWDGR